MRTLDSVAAFARFELSRKDQDHIAKLLVKEHDWQTWINQIELHGLSGFAHLHTLNHQLPMPEQVFGLLEQLKLRHSKAAKMRHKALAEIIVKFGEHAIPVLALKGLALAVDLYENEYLRPMRDMDLLVPREDIKCAGKAIQELGYILPDHQPSKFMESMHQLPNATKNLDGLVSSVELHHDGISREVSGHFYYPTNLENLKLLDWHGLKFNALDDVDMLHQVTRHLEGLHSNALLKLINVMDVVGLAASLVNSEKWEVVQRDYPNVLNTLRCLNFWTPLPENLSKAIADDRLDKVIVMAGVGEIMGSLSYGVKAPSLKEKFTRLFLPSDWWMHLHYNVDPSARLTVVKLARHPVKVISWFFDRALSFLINVSTETLSAIQKKYSRIATKND